MDATTQLAALRGKVEEAEHRVKQVKAAQRLATEELKGARTNLAQIEQASPTPKALTAAKERLEKARIAVEYEPWTERQTLAQNRVQQAQRAVRQYTREHLLDLVTAKETEGEAAAATMLAAAETLITANQERYRIVGEIGALWKTLANPQQGDVTCCSADRLVSEAGVLIEQSEDAAPRLNRDRLAQVLEEAEPVHAVTA